MSFNAAGLKVVSWAVGSIYRADISDLSYRKAEGRARTGTRKEQSEERRVIEQSVQKRVAQKSKDRIPHPAMMK